MQSRARGVSGAWSPRVFATPQFGHPEEAAICIGRSYIGEEITRFQNAIRTPPLFNHRTICSSNKRAANYGNATASGDTGGSGSGGSGGAIGGG